ncbi:hypothetical protein NPIL_218521 [Nephila pilipes]|uniref:Uncharacterized protein n=1 Tax=Nephila pilipes TaxID=299642 RepID=A0A8X6M7J0_NEPPI|nr:hypothetical protein NPIL_218521 [Nephila pilipes]
MSSPQETGLAAVWKCGEIIRRKGISEQQVEDISATFTNNPTKQLGVITGSGNTNIYDALYELLGCPQLLLFTVGWGSILFTEST